MLTCFFVLITLYLINILKKREKTPDESVVWTKEFITTISFDWDVTSETKELVEAVQIDEELP